MRVNECAASGSVAVQRCAVSFRRKFGTDGGANDGRVLSTRERSEPIGACMSYCLERITECTLRSPGGEQFCCVGHRLLAATPSELAATIGGNQCIANLNPSDFSLLETVI